MLTVFLFLNAKINPTKFHMKRSKHPEMFKYCFDRKLATATRRRNVTKREQLLQRREII